MKKAPDVKKIRNKVNIIVIEGARGDGGTTNMNAYLAYHEWLEGWKASKVTGKRGGK